ncbi:hypothetical protein ACFW6F_11195 [Streptomyces sp. NPDC058746]|uniref:hypothetical protein n=1 Tax=Streptomyces sp. NPDC058746 TaxID=3346622 RepID=UPI0036A6213C
MQDIYGEAAPDAKGTAAPAPEPAVLAWQAVRELVMPEPVVRTNPDHARAQLVRVPTWMWLEQGVWRPVSKTVEVPGVSVTATASPVSVTWDMGDGATVTCRGPGTAYSADVSATAGSPDCGQMYRRSSAGQPGDAYRLTASIRWDVAWRGGGQQGLFPGLQTRTTVPVRVAEAQALVTSSS